MSFVDKLKKITSEISTRREYVHGDKGILEKYDNNLKQWQPETKIGKASRVAGLGTIDLTWFLFCLMKYATQDTISGLNNVFLDNKIIDKLKSKKQNIDIKYSDSKFNQFFKILQKEHPVAAARLHLWMVYALFTGLTISGIKVAEHKEDIKDIYKEWVIKIQKNKKYKTDDKNFVQDFVQIHWEEIVIGLLEFETYHEKPKLQTGEKRYTYGPGLTWVYIDGKQYPCIGIYKDTVSNFSDEEIWNQVKQHCTYRGECLSLIQSGFYKNGFTKVSADQVLAVFFASYQLPNTTKGIIKKLKDAENDEQKIIDAFIAGNEVKSKWRNGTNIRRWWCAMLYTGKISMDDFVNMDRDAFSKIDLNKILQNGHFIFDSEIVEYALKRKKTDNGTVQDFVVSKKILDKETTVYISKKPELKVIAFNKGIKNLNMLRNNKDNNVVYHFNQEYQA